MGYYTKFSLEWTAPSYLVYKSCEHDKPAAAQFCPQCGRPVGDVTPDERISEYIRANKAGFYGIDEFGDSIDLVKWYPDEYRACMVKMSAMFKGVLFVLSGVREEGRDIWREYYLDGKYQRAEAKITFDEFDESKLVDLTKSRADV